MIVKKVCNPRKSSSKAVRIGSLTNYVRDPQKSNQQEKVLYANGCGFICDTHKSQQAEMLALSQEAVRSKDTINHYVLSWREGEQPSPKQVDQAVDIFMDELGVQDHQVIYALHGDTDNIHLHIVLNRVHPETLKVIHINKGFDIEAAHQAIARIEHAQGWEREQNGRYVVLENGELGREHLDPNKPRQPKQPKRDMENITGEKSAERIAIEEAAPIIKCASNWQELHRELAAIGMKYEKFGRGAMLFVGDVGVKASSADREASFPKLQKRLGPYEPPTAQHQPSQRIPQPLVPDLPGLDFYIVARKKHYEAKNAALGEQREKHAAERKKLAEQQEQYRNEILKGSWEGRGEVRNALQSMMAVGHAAEKAVLMERQQKERAALREEHFPLKGIEQWYRWNKLDIADQWRYRSCTKRLDVGAFAPRIRPERIAKCQQPSSEKNKAVAHKARRIRYAPPGTLVYAYRRHHHELMRGKKASEVDLSRVDAMIAVRMRVTGHDQDEIEKTLRVCAPLSRAKDEGRDWDDYAQRTARYAFSAFVNGQVGELEKYRKQWASIDGTTARQQYSQQYNHADLEY